MIANHYHDNDMISYAVNQRFSAIDFDASVFRCERASEIASIPLNSLLIAEILLRWKKL